MSIAKPTSRLLIVGAVLLGVILAFVLWRFEPTGESYYLKCAFHAWTGCHCPGCGTTRALHSLLHGDLWQAIRFNPLLIVGGPIMAVLIYRQRRRERISGIAAPKLAWALFIVMTAYFIGRNIPSPTRSWLAPPAGEDSAADREQARKPEGLTEPLPGP